MYMEKAKPDKQFNYAFDNEIPIILWLAEDELKAGEVKVKVTVLIFRFFTRDRNTLSNVKIYWRIYDHFWRHSGRISNRARLVSRTPKKAKNDVNADEYVKYIRSFFALGRYSFDRPASRNRLYRFLHR